MSEWQGPWKCDKCGFIREGLTHRRLTYRECGNMNRCNGKMLPYDRRALAALTRSPPPAEPGLREEDLRRLAIYSVATCDINGGNKRDRPAILLEQAIAALALVEGEKK